MNKREEREEELDKFYLTIYTEITNGGSEKLKQLIKEYQDLVDFAMNEWGFAHEAAGCNNVDALKVFLDAGIHPDSSRPEPFRGQTLLWEAINAGAYNVVLCLLDAGANINLPFKGRFSSPLVGAVYEGDIKIVKTLIERGADIHYTYIHSDRKEKFNALKWAVEKEYHEIADYLRSLGAVMPVEEEKPNIIPGPEEELLVALSKYFKGKPLPLGITEIVPASVPLMVHIFPPVKGKRKTTIFVTSGLIEYALAVPKGKKKYMFAEYFIEMPGAWPVKDKDLEQEKNLWPIHWLKAISRYPHEKGTYYGEKATVDIKMIPSLTMPDGKYHSALVERCEDLTLRVSQDGRLVIYYRITPLVPSSTNCPECGK